MKTFFTIMFWACIVMAIATFATAIYDFTHSKTLWGVMMTTEVLMNIASSTIFYILKEDKI